MKTLKIAYISDEHLDFFVKERDPNREKFDSEIDRYIEHVLKPEKADILICAGDISHYNNLTKLYFKKLKKYFNYIVFVHGNHDLYLVSDSQKYKYKKDSFNRLQELRDFADTEDNIYFLEGDVIEIQGLKIGGLANWYNLPTQGHISQWIEYMNDPKLIIEGAEPRHICYSYSVHEIIPTFDTQKFRKEVEKQWDNIEKQKCDILVTHICPVIIPDNVMNPRFLGNKNNIFFMTDDLQRVKNTNAEIVIYGHNHESKEWDFEDINFKSNAVGYPKEYSGQGLKYFDFILD
jgi:predicted phosphodiesterase